MAPVLGSVAMRECGSDELVRLGRYRRKTKANLRRTPWLRSEERRVGKECLL